MFSAGRTLRPLVAGWAWSLGAAVRARVGPEVAPLGGGVMPKRHSLPEPCLRAQGSDPFVEPRVSARGLPPACALPPAAVRTGAGGQASRICPRSATPWPQAVSQCHRGWSTVSGGRGCSGRPGPGEAVPGTRRGCSAVSSFWYAAGLCLQRGGRRLRPRVRAVSARGPVSDPRTLLPGPPAPLRTRRSKDGTSPGGR